MASKITVTLNRGTDPVLITGDPRVVGAVLDALRRTLPPPPAELEAALSSVPPEVRAFHRVAADFERLHLRPTAVRAGIR